jgi:hypothetical protein
MIAVQMEWVLLITGLATAGAMAFFLTPVPMMRIVFGQAPFDVPSLLVVRHWGLLVGLVGALLIYAAYHTDVRVPTLIVAIVEKAAIAIGLLLSPLRRRPAVLAIALADGGMAGVYLIYLIVP